MLINNRAAKMLQKFKAVPLTNTVTCNTYK